MKEPAWARFARRRLALSRWCCEPDALPAAQKAAFEAAWVRQKRLETAVVEAAGGENIPDAVLSAVAASLAPQLDETPFSAADRQAVIRHHALMEMQFTRVAASAPQPDDIQVLAWYQQHQAQFMRPEQRLTSHLLVTVDSDGETVRRQVAHFHQEIVRTRTAFSQLAQRYSHCPSALEGGRLGWISRGLLYPELEQALFALKENDVSAPIETALGWHLVWCEHIREPAPMAKNEALAKAREHLYSLQQQQWQRRWLATLLNDASA